MATQYGSRVITGLVATPSQLAPAGLGGGRVHYWHDTIELAAASAGEIIYLARIPSNLRIMGRSLLSFDDLASSGSPTLDIGLYPVRTGDFTLDEDALNDGIDCATAAGTAPVIKDIANYGKRAWEFINGLTADPKCDLWLAVTTKDASTNQTGTITLELFGATD
jgi:hypothetical protein